MSQTRLGPAVAAVLLSIRCIVIAAPETQPSSEIETQIRRLSADDFRQRQAAQDRLVAMGDAAREALTRASTDAAADEETRTRAEAALAQIAENATAGPSYVTIHLKDAPPAELFRQLSQQCGVSLEPSKPDLWEKRVTTPVTIDIDRQPFWAAMQRITDLTGVELRPEDGGVKLNAGKQADASGARYVSGPFLIVANSITRNRTVVLANHGNAAAAMPSSSFMMVMTAFAEPKMRVLGSTVTARLEQAADENGNSLVPPASGLEKKTSITDATSGRWSFRVPLEYPQKNPGQRIVSLKGSIEVLLQSKFQPVEFPGVMTARNVARAASGAQVVLNEMRKKSEKYELAMSITFEPGSLLDKERVRQSIESSDLRLLDAGGNAYPRSSCSAGGNDQRLDVLVKFRIPSGEEAPKGLGEPIKAVWNVPGAVRQVSVPFEFAELPIP